MEDKLRIPIKKYIMDETKDWEGRYKDLEAHHLEETTWMIEEIKRLRQIIKSAPNQDG